jgi:hypothetical protein
MSNRQMQKNDKNKGNCKTVRNLQHHNMKIYEEADV